MLAIIVLSAFLLAMWLDTLLTIRRTDAVVRGV